MYSAHIVPSSWRMASGRRPTTRKPAFSYRARARVLPSMYSYRGYDAAMIFCRKMFTGIDGSMLTETFTPLATSYNFDLVGGLYVNTRWVREDYKSNFTIEVK